jgi:hypothetical protein
LELNVAGAFLVSINQKRNNANDEIIENSQVIIDRITPTSIAARNQ